MKYHQELKFSAGLPALTVTVTHALVPDVQFLSVQNKFKTDKGTKKVTVRGHTDKYQQLFWQQHLPHSATVQAGWSDRKLLWLLGRFLSP